MRRSTPLRTYAPLRRRVPLVAVGRPKLAALRPAVPTEARAALAIRSGGYCEAQLFGCTGTATDVHHRISQKAGGRRGAAKARHDLSGNTLHLCRVCHAWVTARAAEAYDLGLSLREWQTPTAEPVVRRGELVFLADDGSVHDFEEVGA